MRAHLPQSLPMADHEASRQSRQLYLTNVSPALATFGFTNRCRELKSPLRAWLLALERQVQMHLNSYQAPALDEIA